MTTANRKSQKIIHLNRAPENSDSPSVLGHYQHQSETMMAVLEPESWRIVDGNPQFFDFLHCHYPPELNQERPENRPWSQWFSLAGGQSWDRLYRQHLWFLVLRDVYDFPLKPEIQEPQPAIAKVQSHTQEFCFIQYWLHSSQLQVSRKEGAIDELADVDFQTADLWDGAHWGQRLCLENYTVRGQLFWEAIAVTEQELHRRLINLLLDPKPLLNPRKFHQLNQYIRNLFHSDGGLFFSIRHNTVQKFTIADNKLQRCDLCGVDDLKDSHLFQAAIANAVIQVPDLQSQSQGPIEAELKAAGYRSLLIIPLVVQTQQQNHGTNLMGLVVIKSREPHHFTPQDRHYGQGLIPALRNALRQTAQIKFSHIHPAVEWRFQEEAERRSWGLPAEAIVFRQVYPLYGISDIRGSSRERNLAVQKDLLEQYRLAIAIVDRVCAEIAVPFLGQLRLDLQERQQQLGQEIHVEDEVTAVEYLQENLETYFDHFQTLGPPVQEAIAQYQNACHNEHHCVYVARQNYDQMILTINNRLKHNWEEWQQKMQGIISHYCDVEVSDGMDHMIYAGASINQTFQKFHLHALRYEQLRAVCDCAQICFSLKHEFSTTIELTHLVLVQDVTIDIFHDEQTERLFDVKGTKDTRYEIVKKRIDKGVDAHSQTRITQPGMLTIVYSTEREWQQYRQYLYYLHREGYVAKKIESGQVQPLQGVTGLKFARVEILPASTEDSRGPLGT